MNKIINNVIERYIQNSEDTPIDYAFLINGFWGCGKTYYIVNELKNIVEKHGLIFIYISLYGVSDFSDVRKKVLIQILYNLNKKDNNDNDDIFDYDLLESSLEIAKDLPNYLSAIFSGIKLIKNKVENHKLNKIDYKKYVLIFDDLERISDKLSHNEIMGPIYENYIKKGAKTIFVTDESNISKNSNYFKIKEKIIRTTLNYIPDFYTQISYFISNYFKEGDIHNIIIENIDFFIDQLNTIEIRNLRTIAFIFDNYNYILKSINVELINSLWDSLFTNLMIITNEYKNGSITIDNLKDKKGLDGLSFIKYLEIAEVKVDHQEYKYKFYERYIKNLKFSFHFIEEIFNFILTGYLEVVLLEKRLNDMFRVIDSEQQKSINTLANYLTINEVEYSQAFKSLLIMLSKGEYSTVQLPYIYTLLRFFEEKNMTLDWNYNVEEIINQAYEESIKNDQEILLNNFYEREFHCFDETKVDDYYEELKNRIKAHYNNLNKQSKLKKVKDIFNHSESDFNLFLSLFNDPELGIFDVIVHSDSISEFYTLSEYGLHSFEIVLGSENKYILSPQKESLQIIVNNLQENLDTYAVSNFRKCRFNIFIDHLSKFLKMI